MNVFGSCTFNYTELIIKDLNFSVLNITLLFSSNKLTHHEVLESKYVTCANAVEIVYAYMEL